MEIKFAKEKDLNDIYLIEQESFKEPFSIKNLRDELCNPFSTVLLLEDENEISGFIIYYTTFDSATICQIAVKNSKRKLGFADFLLEKMEDFLIKGGVEFVTLEVRVSNIPAINLYKKHNYKEITIKQNYYKDGEDAIYMMKGLI